VDKFHIKKISEIDTKKLLQFYQVSFQYEKSILDNYQWRYRSEFNEFEPLILIIDNQICGHAGLIPIDLKINDKKQKAIWFTDFYITSEQRSKGYGKLLAEEWMKICPIQITICNDQSLKVFKKLKWSNNNSFVRRLKIYNYLNIVPIFRKLNRSSFIKDDLQDLLGDTIKGLNRVSAIVSNLTKVTHAGELEMKACQINDIIEESIKVVWNELKYNMTVEKYFAPLPLLACHSGEIHQVFMNLFLNASHACDEEGLLIIKTYTKESKGKNWIVIEVSDNGKGMPSEVRKKIFDPFFTTKPVGVGTGLGLSVSFGIIEKHKGTIKVASEEGIGTTFSIHLPLNEQIKSTETL